jgi:hypothetical protein
MEALRRGRDPHPALRARDVVAIVLSIGLATALNIIVIAVLYDAITSQGPGLSENATQILTGWGGGIIGVVGSYLGFRVGEQSGRRQDEPADPGD